jgi:hypothetical protein
MSEEQVVIPEDTQFHVAYQHTPAEASFAYSLVLPLLDGRRGSLQAEPAHEESGDVPIPWVIRRHGEPDQVITWSPRFGHFRAVLAKIGFIYLHGQPYGGLATGHLSYRKKNFFYTAYMSNNNYEMAGFWVRLYVKPMP